MVKVHFSAKFEKDVGKLRREQGKLCAKVFELLVDIDKTPFSGKGKPEALKGNLSGWWSRRITDKHRLIYRVRKTDQVQIIEISSCFGHYGDK